jgi:hypothetical protein
MADGYSVSLPALGQLADSVSSGQPAALALTAPTRTAAAAINTGDAALDADTSAVPAASPGH